jgi:hypothetical protein
VVRFRRRRNRRVRGAAPRREAWARAIRWMLRIAAVAAVVAMGGRIVWQAVRSSPHFAVNQVEVVGVETARVASIRDLVGVNVGVNTWDVDLQAIRDRVLSDPWVASVHVRRRLPGGLVVTVREHREIAAVRLGDAVYAVDRRGRIFAPLDVEASSQLPQVTGVLEEDVSERGRRAEGTLRRTASLIRILRRHHRVTTVHVDRKKGVTVRVADLLDVPIHFGWGDWKRKRRRLDAVLDLWSGRESQLEAVSLAFGDQVVVRLWEGIAAREPAA